MNKSKIIPTIKKWLLMISMSLGIGGYFLILSLNLGQETNHQIATVVTNMLPYLLFVMLFLEFSKIEPRDLFPKKWLWMVFAFQIVMAFVTIAIQKYGCMPQWTTAMWNGWLASMLSPTATAVAVMSSKLGGKAASATTYAVLSSLLAACAIPLIFPLASPQAAGLSFWMLFTKIFAKVFPVIILPLMISLSLRKLAPKAHDFIARFAKDKSFYLWSVCIMVNTAQVIRLIFGGIADGWVVCIYVVFGGFISALNFMVGKKFGTLCDDRISAGQSLGQKNTILGIWMAMTFLDPASGIIVGAYMLWQNGGEVEGIAAFFIPTLGKKYSQPGKKMFPA